MKALLPLLACCIVVASAATVQASSVEGAIVDADTAAAIPYVQVGVPQRANGTVANGEGRFSLALNDGDDQLLFTAIGYQPKVLPVSLFPLDQPVALQPIKIQFEESVRVTAPPAGEPETYGRSYPAKGYGMGFASGLLGSQLATVVRIDKPTFLESAHFTLTRPGGESFLYRVNLFAFSKGEIGENLLKKNVLVEGDQKRGVLSVDLREHALIVDQDLLLSLEWVHDDREAGNANVMFRAKPKVKGEAYFKPTSQTDFIKVPRHRLAFYLKGYPIPRDSLPTPN